MAIRPILCIPAPCLREIAAPVGSIDDEIKTLVGDMFETMYHAPGVGLAAPQIGVKLRVIVMDPAGEEEKPAPLAMVNPAITWTSAELRVHQEGCLSIPEHYEDVERPDTCRVAFMDEQGEQHEITCDGLLSIIVQHEIDHLNGKLFIDHLSRLKRERIVRKFRKLAKRAAE